MKIIKTLLFFTSCTNAEYFLGDSINGYQNVGVYSDEGMPLYGVVLNKGDS